MTLLGPPGAGKGTQAKVLAKRLNLVHISTGDILRQNVLDNTELGRRARDFMDRGALVPDELVTLMLTQRLEKSDIKNGFILDGYPRNVNQAEALDDILKQRNLDLDLIVYLETSEHVIIQRLSGRLVCRSCGANFHSKNMPPKKDNFCDNCNSQLYQRTDDKEETVRKRLEVYLKEASGLIQYYAERQKLHRLSANEEAEIVLEKIMHLVKNHNDSLKVRS